MRANNRPIAMLAAGLLVAGILQAGSQPAPERAPEAAVEAAVRQFISAIDTLDTGSVAASFTSDATAFYPFAFTPDRLEGREAIRAAQARGFDLMRSQFPPGAAPQTLGLQPRDLDVRMLGPNAAVVTWHSHRPTRAGRRTSVLERVDGQWLTVSHHASNMARPD